MTKITLLAQLLAYLPGEAIRKAAEKAGSNKHNKGIDTWTHLVSMVFCHLSNAGSLRDISNGLRSITGNKNHLGCKLAPSKSSISYINQHRDYKVFEEFFQLTLQHLGQHVGFERKNLQRLKRKIFLMDATVIPLCSKVFDWAHFRKQKGAVKLHTVLDYDGCLPCYAHISDGKKHDVTVAKTLRFPRGSVVVCDRGYLDFSWLDNLDSSGVLFVTRAKDNMAYAVTESFDVKAEEGFLSDENIRLTSAKSADSYPKELRRVAYKDPETGQELVFLTNQKSWTAETVAALYKERWNIEVFFKHIKTHLRIKTFVGTSENAVRIQLWTALITILLLKAMQKIAEYNWHLSNLVTFLRLNLFVKIDLKLYLDKPFEQESLPSENIQLSLFT
jgi:transposase